MCADFAIAGSIGAWMIDQGKIIHYKMVEPKGDKVAVKQYRKGAELSDIKGQEEEAITALTLSIEKYDKHSQAYERRGYVNRILGNLKDALYDLNKSIRLDENNASAYYGRGKLHLQEGNLEKSVSDLQMAIKKSIALQSVHWMARRLKGEIHWRLNQYKEAEFELMLFTKRKFPPNDINHTFKLRSLFYYGLTLVELEKFEDALIVLNLCHEQFEAGKRVDEGQLLAYRGRARRELGKPGYLQDWERAVELGFKRANRWINDSGPASTA